MKIHILSDLHTEVSKYMAHKVDADLVVLAGDIGREVSGLVWACETYKDLPILYVPGNHEFYGADRPETLAALRTVAREYGVHLLDEDEVVINGVRFLGCTLWTDFRLFGDDKKQQTIASGLNGLNDFRVIREGRQGLFTPQYSVELHEKSLAWLKGKLDTPFDGKTVVVTHHLPSAKSVVEQFKDNLIAACFASELDYLFGKPVLWIHGHTHYNLDYEVNGTRIICNPRGYETFYGAENTSYDPRLVIKV